ncbi:MAG: IS66 family transposase [Betaproteobacteria bacterium]|nr:IS66 family transposase [Betaproteobacteria bacterium]
MSAITLPANLDQLSADELRRLLVEQDRELNWRKVKIDKLTHEVAYRKRHYFGVNAERLPVEQGQLFEETLAADMAAITEELAQLSETKPKGQAKRKPLPAELPRTEIHHEPESTTCACGCQMKRIGEDVAEKLDYTPGTFTVERHIRGKWACAQCETLVHAPVPAHVIDKGIPTTGLLAHVLIAKYLDHLPLYRQEGIFGRAGWPIPQSTLAERVGQMGVTLQPLVDALKVEMLTYPVLHADETQVAMLDPGAGKTHRAYLWSYSIGAFEPIKAVIYDFADSRAGKHAREFLGDWRGTLVCDDYSGYKALIADGVTEAGCMAHARRKFFDLHANNQSQIAQQALATIQKLYQVEREVAELSPDERRRIRQEQAKPILDELHDWLTRHRLQVPNGSSTAKAIDYRLKRWTAFAHSRPHVQWSC